MRRWRWKWIMRRWRWKWIMWSVGLVIVVMGILVGEQYRERAVREKRYWQELNDERAGRHWQEFLAN